MYEEYLEFAVGLARQAGAIQMESFRGGDLGVEAKSNLYDVVTRVDKACEALIARSITVVSTVPTLAGLWPDEALDAVRLLIFGGEACPPELAARLATDGRELWNTYGPTEATVVACATTMDGVSAVSIGLPLRGWDLAVVDTSNQPVAMGETGELVIGGVGLAPCPNSAGIAPTAPATTCASNPTACTSWGAWTTR